MTGSLSPDNATLPAGDDSDAQAEMPSAADVPLWRKLIGYVLGGAILFFLGLYLVRVWDQMPEGGIQINWGWFTLSCLLTSIFFVLQAYGWKIIVSGLGPRIGFLKALKYWYFSQVAKYVPGKVMLPLMRIRFLKPHGTSIQAVLLSIAVEILLMIITALIIALAATSSQLSEISKAFTIAYFLIIPAGVIGIHPRILEPVVNWGLKLIHRKPIQITLQYGTMLWLLVIFSVGWIIYGLSAYFLCLAMTDAVALNHLDLIMGMFAFAWIAGFLSFITPGGIGVREGVLILLLAPILPEPIAAIIVLVSRLQWTGLEILTAGLLIPVKGVAKS